MPSHSMGCKVASRNAKLNSYITTIFKRLEQKPTKSLTTKTQNFQRKRRTRGNSLKIIHLRGRIQQTKKKKKKYIRGKKSEKKKNSKKNNEKSEN